MACDAFDDSLGQIWSDAARKTWYETSQGSRLMPDTWYRALRRADDGTPLAERANMQRYGFAFCDDKAVDPIGFVLDSDAQREPAIGLTCAACHTGILNYGTSNGDTHQMTVYAGAADMDFQGFTRDVFAAVQKVWTGPFDQAQTNPDWQEFASATLGRDAGPEAKAALHADVTNWLQSRRDIQAAIDQGGNWGHGRQDAVQVILNTVATLADSQLRGALPPATAPVSIPSVWLAPHTARVQWNGSASKSVDIGLAGPISTGAMIRNVSEVIGVFAEVALPDYPALAEGKEMSVHSSVRLGNLVKLERALADVTPPKWPEIWGRIDRTSADYLAGERLYDTHCAACHARIDRENPLAEIVDATGSALIANPVGGQPFVRVVDAFATPGQTGPVVGTDPMMVCNAATHSSWSGKMTAFTNIFAILRSFSTKGLTGIVVERFPVSISTLRLIEDLSIRILWEKRDEIVDVQKFDLREKTRTFMETLYGDSLAVTGGEIRIARAEIAPSPTPATHHLTDLDAVRRVCTQMLELARLSDPAAPAPAYKAGPLAGIFATAPYLHNGSVPSLDALLRPSDQRPKQFAVGDVLFDRDGIGLGLPIKGGQWSMFTVTDPQGAVIAGNSNAGHDYPVQPLSDPERAQLIAYLKGL